MTISLFAHIEAHLELAQKNLQEVLDGLPPHWFSDQRVEIDIELEKQLTKELEPFPKWEQEKKRKKRLPKPWKRRERDPLLWKRSICYMVALLWYLRPDFDDHTLEEHRLRKSRLCTADPRARRRRSYRELHVFVFVGRRVHWISGVCIPSPLFRVFLVILGGCHVPPISSARVHALYA